MDTRRLQKTGGSSITITLPKKWIEQNELSDKDVLKLSSPTSNVLLLEPISRKKKISRSTVKFDGVSDTWIVREIVAHYIAGVDEITVENDRIAPEQRTKIRNLSNFLTGFELIDETAEKIVLRNIFDPSKFPVTKNLEKMFQTTISMFHDSLKAIKENDKLLAKDVVGRDFEIDKLLLIIARQRNSLELNKISEEEIGLNLSDLHFYEDVATQVERIADHAVKIAQEVESLNKTFNDIEIDTILMLLNKTFEMVKTLDKRLANEMLDAKSNIKAATLSYKKIDTEESFIGRFVEDTIDRVRKNITNISELTLDQAVKKAIEK